MKFDTGSWRNVIVARRSRKSSVSFDAPMVLRELAGHQKYRTLIRKTLLSEGIKKIGGD